MRKVFLSHSSTDKTYVEQVAKKIGIDNCVYDKYTFEEGMPILEEIYKGLDATDIFVFFISNAALDSRWVKKERKRMKNLLDAGEVLRFYPIIIQNGLTHEDSRIPKWMRMEYNIRPIFSSNRAASKIRERMREVAWEENPGLKYKRNLFIGRNKEIAKFEERKSDFDKPGLCCIVASSAFVEIGRKAYMDHVLKKNGIMVESYHYNLISLERHESIEDFILKMSDLGIEDVDIVALSRMSLSEKIQCASNLARSFQLQNEYIFINDHGVLIRPNREMAEWFEDILNSIEPKIVFGIASVYDMKERNANERVFSVRIPELDRNERGLLLGTYCDLNGLTPSGKQMKTIASCLSGYPKQIFYAVQMIKDDGIGKTLNQLDELVAYADGKAQAVLDKFVDTGEKMQFLAFLSSFEFIGYEILEAVYEKKMEYRDYMERFLSVSICEFLGTDGEYVHVNDVLKDILFRQKTSMGKELAALYRSLLDRTVDEDFLAQTDLAGYYNVVKEKLGQGDVDEKYVIPSHYLKCIIDQYNHRRYEKAERLCKRILDGDRLASFDEELVYALRYYYCQALARDHNANEFHNVIGSVRFKPEDKEFLYGFFHRLNGNPEKAIEHLSRAVDIRENFSKARRELATAYILAENYEAASYHCKRNYREDPENPYFIQHYFEILVHQYMGNWNGIDGEKESSLVEKMQKLIDVIQEIGIPQAKQMGVCMRAEFEAYVNRDFRECIGIIQQGIAETNDTSIYLYLTQFDIAYRVRNVDRMKEAIDQIEKVSENQKYFSNALHIREARYYAVMGDYLSALESIRKIRNMPKETVRRIQAEVDALTSRVR